MQIVGDELKKLIVSNENWDQTTEGIHISTPLNDFNNNQISDDSIDLRISNTGFIMNKDYKSINTLSKDSFENHFERIELTTDGYVLQPGEVLYIGTIERIGLKGPYIGRIAGRSTYSRLGLSISSSQDKFCGHNDAIVCLQLRNNSNQGLVIFPHQKLVQIMIYKTLGTPSATGSAYANELTYTLPQIGDKERFQYSEFTADKIAKIPSPKKNIAYRGLDAIRKKKKRSSILNLIIGGVFTLLMTVINFISIQDSTKQFLCIMFLVFYLLLSIPIVILVDEDE